MLIALALMLTTQATLPVQCDYWDQATGVSYTGVCTVAYGTDATIVRFKDKRIVIVETGRQGQWQTNTIDGKPGVRYEVNRQSYRYSTLSLDMTLDVTG